MSEIVSRFWRHILKMAAVASLITYQRMLSDHLRLAERTGCFQNPRQELETSAIVYSMVEMAKAHNLNIYKYLKYLLEHRPNYKMTDEQLSAVLPWKQEVI